MPKTIHSIIIVVPDAEKEVFQDAFNHGEHSNHTGPLVLE